MHTRVEMGLRANGNPVSQREMFNALISVRRFSSNRRETETLLRLKLKLFTSDNEPGRFGCQRVLRGEIAGCDLALPQTVVELQSGRSHPQGTVANVWPSYPLVFLQVHPDRLKQFVAKSIGRRYPVIRSRFLDEISRATLQVSYKLEGDHYRETRDQAWGGEAKRGQSVVNRGRRVAPTDSIDNGSHVVCQRFAAIV